VFDPVDRRLLTFVVLAGAILVVRVDQLGIGIVDL